MKITHVLADGSVKKDITGHKVEKDQAPEFYRILKNEIRKLNKEVEK